jgi:hypothetical protein
MLRSMLLLGMTLFAAVSCTAKHDVTRPYTYTVHPTPASITINEGESVVLTASITNDQTGDEVANGSDPWWYFSGDEDVATVESDGTVTGVAPGTTKIAMTWATAGTVTTTVDVTVNPAP